MSETILQESKDTQNAIDSKIMGILNPTMHHHDLLQSYVLAPMESPSNSKQYEELENADKTPSLGAYIDTESTDDADKRNYFDGVKKNRRNDRKQQKDKSEKLSVESEVNIQKKKK
ncbi:uncharacterized protein LOC108626658 [Ceratina calcarata]|uniref:Uncharacterized protein LOC108626658 n=1 Tax=Ceratina calcarata TaxID=156304 RepID=A0AAJ7WC37_9HYME|nr:uncharacterized protein LOC108626658 [Ceratina calcarata]